MNTNNPLIPPWAWKNGKPTFAGIVAAGAILLLLLGAMLSGSGGGSTDPYADRPQVESSAVVSSDGSNPYAEAENRGQSADAGGGAGSYADFRFAPVPSNGEERNGALYLNQMLTAMGVPVDTVARDSGTSVYEVAGFPIQLGDAKLGDYATFVEPNPFATLCIAFNNEGQNSRSVVALMSWPEGTLQPYLSVQLFSVAGLYGANVPSLTQIKSSASMEVPPDLRADPQSTGSKQTVALLYMSTESFGSPIVSVCINAYTPDTHLYGVTLEYWR